MERTMRLNGEPHTTTAATLARLVEELGLAPGAVVAEVNGTIIAAGEFENTALHPEDAVELIHFVGGG